MIAQRAGFGKGIEAYSGPLRSVVACGLVASFGLLWAVVENIASIANVSIEQLVWTRYATHLLVLLFVFGRGAPLELVRTNRPFVQACRSLLMLGMPLFFVIATHFLGVQDILSVFWITLLAVAIVPARRLSLINLAAGVAAYAGVFLVLGATGRVMGVGAVFALAMGACFVGYLRLTQVLSADSTATNLFHSAVWVFLVLSFRMPFVWTHPSLRAWAAMAAVGILGLLSLYFLDIAIRIGGAAAFVPTLYLQPVFTAIHGARFGVRSELGAAMIVLATLVAVYANALDKDSFATGLLGSKNQL